MTVFSGEEHCKLDAKGRINLPSVFRKQMSPEAGERFMLVRGFEKCLVLYPMDEWRVIEAAMNSLNPFITRDREFVRYFFRGNTALQMDAAGRILLPKKHLEYAGIEKEMVLFGYRNNIELWTPEDYEALLTQPPSDYKQMAEDVMRNINLNQFRTNNQNGGGGRDIS